MIIKDGQTGITAGVNTENQLKTAAVTVTKEHETNHQDGLAFSVPITATPSGAGVCFGYIKNTSDTDMLVSEMALTSLGGAEIFQIKLGDTGVPIGGNTIIPVNRNAGSGNIADCTVLNGSEITGLDGGEVVFGWSVASGASTQHVTPLTGFIVPKNKVLSVYAVNGSIPIMFGMGITFHKPHNL